MYERGGWSGGEEVAGEGGGEDEQTVLPGPPGVAGAGGRGSGEGPLAVAAEAVEPAGDGPDGEEGAGRGAEIGVAGVGGHEVAHEGDAEELVVAGGDVGAVVGDVVGVEGAAVGGGHEVVGEAAPPLVDGALVDGVEAVEVLVEGVAGVVAVTGGEDDAVMVDGDALEEGEVAEAFDQGEGRVEVTDVYELEGAECEAGVGGHGRLTSSMARQSCSK